MKYFLIFYLFSKCTGNDYSCYDDGGTQELAGNVFFVEEDFTTDYCDETGRLFYQSHDCNFACRISVSNEKSLITNYKHNRKDPDPAVFYYTKTQAFSFNNNIDNIIEDNEKHIPELKLGAGNIFHKDFVHKTGEGIEEA